MKIKRNGLIWNIICINDNNHYLLKTYSNTLTSCDIHKMVATGLITWILGTLAFLVLGGLSLVIAGDFIAYIAASVWMTALIEPSGLVGALLLLVAAGALFGTLILCVATTKIAKDKLEEAPAVAELYRSWRDKYCTKVEIIDDRQQS